MPALRDFGASALCSALAWLSRRRLPQTHGTITVAGLEASVEVIRDRWGVPHIYAANERDLMFAQGFVHAQDRLWQMEYSRRLVAGRLAEALGPEALPVDRWLRTLGMRRVAEVETARLEGEVRAALEAYAAGVNACIARGRLPIEFTLLRYRPEPWSVADTVSWGKMMAWTLSVNWEMELIRARLVDRLGPELEAELEPSYPARCPQIIPPGVDGSGLGRSAEERARRARPFTGPTATEGLGSNNWAIAGTRTASGAPILANDMHLVLTAPAIWYENHLVGGGFDVTGVTFPGVPGVVAGHNGHVAWGYTNGFPDVQDLYIERLRRSADGHVQYEYRGQWLDAQVIREEIRVRGGRPAVEEVVVTRHGPIINALSPDLAGEQPLALRWTALEPEEVFRALYWMCRARNCREFREALRHWGSPAQNTVYADTEGNIAYTLAGRIPIRTRGDGCLPVPGWTGECEWSGYIPFEELPHLWNPAPGYVVTANNRVVGDDYPHFLGTDYATGDRAQRIRELIEAREKIGVDDVRAMQFDQLSPSARLMAARLGELQVDDPELAAAIEMIRCWDGRLAADSPAACVYETFVRRMIHLLVAGRLGELAEHYEGKGPTPVLAEASLFGCRAWEWLEQMWANPQSRWFDLGHGESRDDVARRALRETVDWLKAELGPDPAGWAWGRLHRLTCAHLLGRVAPLDRLFNRGPYPLGGDGNTIWATGVAGPDLKGETLVGPPFRFIADLADLPHALGLLAPGQSGHVGSPHYDDQMQAWFTGGYHPMLWERADVEREAEARLQLKPG